MTNEVCHLLFWNVIVIKRQDELRDRSGKGRMTSVRACFYNNVHKKIYLFFIFILFYLYIYPLDSQESDGGANT